MWDDVDDIRAGYIPMVLFIKLEPRRSSDVNQYFRAFILLLH